ncbi:DUF342 domain-containing protein [Faecalicatena contorta]|uniref:Flagellar Assembly Protein A N-terminal region domain-containing protein n=1 Tax=Faecalicatena contorta TaxID=39482 RepID=A0A316A1P7_9FIRM|nr:FapA family protein [Faecalicatena contorta]PWJ51503.1 hypothetical protein A8805_102276 [Faecalicatena contorta]SUQ13059.1 hypothetical protein SAMN05216529_102276 [Faecalicatena contorta]
MKEKNRKGLFGFFQNSRNSRNTPEETLDSSAVSLEETAEKTAGDEAVDAAAQEGSSPSAEQIPPLPPIWEPSDDPRLVRINEDILNIERDQFALKAQSLSDAFRRMADAPREDNVKEPEPVAAKPQIYISKDGMAAWIYVIPPFHNGKDISEEDLISFLSQNRVTTGILEDALKTIVREHIYDQPVLVAKGILAINGIDGFVKENFERVLQLEFEEDERGSVDYKHQNNIQSVKKGDVICEITHAVPGVNGTNVMGKPYLCEKKGSEATVPAGRNTVLNEDGTLLISQKTGHVTFANGKFQIEAILKVNGNVDNTTGNLNYDGDIFIGGDVRNGFSVKASGSVDIRGSVEGARITAGGPISIARGMSGNGRGVLTSDSHIKCRYLEHCIVTAKGNVYAESIINSKVESDQDIVVTSGVGAIIGGTLLAANNINANLIGSKVRRLMTELTIANTPKSVEEMELLTKELKQLHHNVSELRKNSLYLETSHREDKEQMFEQLKQAIESLEKREQEINIRLEELRTDDKTQIGLIQCRQLLPVVRIRIGNASLLVNEEHSCGRIYRSSEGEIIIGSR